jgi:O-antigen ligase
MSLGVARAVTSAIALLMFSVSWAPLMLVAMYFIFRPLITPYTYSHYLYYGSIPLTGILVSVIIMSVVFNLIFRKGFSLYIRGQMSFYLFVICCLPSIAMSLDYLASFALLMKLIAGLGIAILVHNAIEDKKDIYIIFSAFALASIFPIIVAFCQKFALVEIQPLHTVDRNFGRIASVFGSYNEYGIFLCLNICVLVSLFLMEQKPVRRVFWFFLTSAATVSLVHSLNRGSWIALILGGIMAYPLYFRKIKIHWVAICFIILAIFFSSTIVNRFERLEKRDEYGQSTNTFAGRIQYWLKIKDLVFEHPLIGWGLGNAEKVTYEKLLSRVPPHNDYLRVLLENGLLGFIAWILYLGIQFFCIVAWCTHQKRWRVNLPIMVCFNYFCIILFTQNIITNVELFPLFMAIMAAAHRWNMLLSSQEYLDQLSGKIGGESAVSPIVANSLF